MELKDRTALVTGAARRIGRAIALGLAEKGCHLVVHYHRAEEEALELVDRARALGVESIASQADLRQLDQIEALFSDIDRSLAGLDLLVNSAAVMQAIDFLSVTESDWDQTIDLNLKAAFFCTQHAARRMRERSGGAIVNISDVAAMKPWTRFPIHCVSKSALQMLTQISARALAPKIRVNAVAPGFILRSDDTDPSAWQALSEKLPLRRAGTPQDIAQAVIFLFENDYITGETVVVDGGRHLI